MSKKSSSLVAVGKENQPEVFLPEDFRTPLDGRPRAGFMDVRTQMLVFPRFANPPARCRIQKCPKSQICPKLVPTIVFGVPIRGAQICKKKCWKIGEKNKNTTISRQIFQFFENNRRDKFGVRGTLNAVRGRRVRNPSFRGPTRSFWPGTCARMTLGRSLGICPPKNSLFGLLFSWTGAGWCIRLRANGVVRKWGRTDLTGF